MGTHIPYKLTYKSTPCISTIHKSDSGRKWTKYIGIWYSLFEISVIDVTHKTLCADDNIKLVYVWWFGIHLWLWMRSALTYLDLPFLHLMICVIFIFVDNLTFVQRLALEKKLNAHNGCVSKNIRHYDIIMTVHYDLIMTVYIMIFYSNTDRSSSLN